MDDIRRYKNNLNEERNSAALYKAMAVLEKNPTIKDIYYRLAATEEKHALKWETLLVEKDASIPSFHLSLRTKTLIWLMEKFGPDFVLPSMVSSEDIAANDYANQPEASEMVSSERAHAILLGQLKNSEQRSGLDGPTLAKMEGRHRSAGGNTLRAAVLGASDGLVSNFNLVMGVAGAAVSSSNILLTGIAGLLAGGISMALGEWISVQSSRELYERQIGIEKEEIETNPEEEIEELILIYQAKGISEEVARPLAIKLLQNPDTALDTLARDELGIDPDDLGGSAFVAAFTSFLLFSVGAIIPVIPFFILTGQTAVYTSIAFSTVGLFLVGAITTLFTGRNIFYSGLRQIIFGLLAAAATYFIGSLIGVSLS